jgi:hypothetical protein
VVKGLFDHEKGEDEEGGAESKLHVEEQAPGMAARKHVTGVERAGGAEAEAH